MPEQINITPGINGIHPKSNLSGSGRRNNIMGMLCPVEDNTIPPIVYAIDIQFFYFKTSLPFNWDY
jgi:hypothetical protein